jgi:hypothetical protein
MDLTFTTVKLGNPQFQFQSIAFGNNTFVVVGNVSSFASTNGVDWQPVPITSGTIIYGAGRFVLANGNFWTSTDGFNWRQTAVPDEPASNVTYGNGVFVAIGHSSIYYSFDGENWTKLQYHGGTTFYGILYGNGQFVIDGTYSTSPFPGGFTLGLLGTSTNGTNWSIGTYTQGVPFLSPSTSAWGNFYNATATSPDCLNITPWTTFSDCQYVQFIGNRLIGFRSNSPNIVISASEGFDNFNRPLARYEYVTGVTNQLHTAVFDGTEYYFVGAGEIILKSKGVPSPPSMALTSINEQTVTFRVTGVPGMTYGLQAFGNDFVGAQPTLSTVSLFDFTLETSSTNVSVPLLMNSSFYRIVER